MRWNTEMTKCQLFLFPLGYTVKQGIYGTLIETEVGLKGIGPPKSILDAIQNWMYQPFDLPDFREEWMCLYCGTPQPLSQINCSKCGAPRNWIL